MITLTFTHIWVPVVITALSIILPFCIPTSGGMFGDMDTLFYLFIGLFFIALTWPIYVFFLWVIGHL